MLFRPREGAKPSVKTLVSRRTGLSRGASLVEVVLACGLIAIVVFVGFRAFGSNLFTKSNGQATAVLCIPGQEGESNDCAGGAGGGAGAGGGGGGVGAPAAGPVCANGVCTGGGNCFVAGTLVSTPAGPVPIEDVRTGDEVLSFREETAELVVGRVGETFVTRDREVVDVHVRAEAAPSDERADGARALSSAESIRATPGHRFFTLDRGWVIARDLEPGELLVDSSGASVAVDSLAAVAEHATVYNFEVDETHTYFVGESHVWVHNPTDCGGGGGTPAPGTPGAGSPSVGPVDPGASPTAAPVSSGGGPSPAIASLTGNLTLTQLRAKYVEAVEAIGPQAQAMLNAGVPEQQVAEWAWAQRRAIGQQFKNLTPLPQRMAIYGRNYNKYGDTLGPTIPYLRAKGKSWSDIIRSSSTAGGGDLGLQGSNPNSGGQPAPAPSDGA